MSDTTDESAIRALIAEWHRATEAGDVESLGPMMAEDAIFLSPGRDPIRGRAAFLAGFRDVAGTAHIAPSGEVREVTISGDCAHVWNHLDVKVTMGGTGKVQRRVGDVLTIFRRGADGRWVLARDANMLVAVEG